MAVVGLRRPIALSFLTARRKHHRLVLQSASDIYATSPTAKKWIIFEQVAGRKIIPHWKAKFRGLKKDGKWEINESTTKFGHVALAAAKDVGSGLEVIWLKHFGARGRNCRLPFPFSARMTRKSYCLRIIFPFREKGPASTPNSNSR
jgi:hypothetical protein